MKPKTKNQAFRGAYWKGYEARMKGKPKVSPYPDLRTHSGEITFSRAFDRYWCEGWEDAEEKCKKGQDERERQT